MKAKRLLLAVIAGLGLTLVTLWGLGGAPVPIVLAAGTTWYVSPGGDDTKGCTNAGGDACKTIAKALTKVNDTDTIIVASGTYTEYNIVVTKSVIIQGAGASNTIVQASIDGTINGRRVFFIHSSANATIADMTIRNGHRYDTGRNLLREYRHFPAPPAPPRRSWQMNRVWGRGD